MTNQFSNKNKTAIITGAAGLLGFQHAAAMLETDANIILTDISLESLESKKQELQRIYQNSNIRCLKMDVTKKEDIESVCEKILSEFKSIDILINNAAIDPKVDSNPGVKESSRFENFDITSWDFQLQVGLTGAMLCSQVFGQTMAKQKNGIILNIASDLSVIAPDQRIYRQEGVKEELQPVKPVTYSVIKHALVGLTKYLASYWAKDGIRVNSLSPGGIYNGQNQVFVEKLASLIPMGRMAEKEEYRSTVQYLCSNASSYMTGQNIVVDGGRSII